MDRFISRAPSWKTMNYENVAASNVKPRASMNNSKKNTSSISDANNKRQSLNISKLPSTFFQSQNASLRLENFFKPVRQESTNNENHNANSNDSGLSSSDSGAASITPPPTNSTTERLKMGVTPKKMTAITTAQIQLLSKQTPNKNQLGKLGDYVNCAVEKENARTVTFVRSPKVAAAATPQTKIVIPLQESPKFHSNPITMSKGANIDIQRSPNKQTPISNAIMQRIHNDLNSPSAGVRMRALKAIRSPTKSAYTHFDISESEKSFIIPPPKARSLEDIMRNIVVHVDVKSGEDNRSAGVRKVIEALGAKTNLTLKADTTHVIFKDGLLSTFKKATQMGIPIVSILWIEACKSEYRICDPRDYPISNLDRYENPELYSKMKRVKYKQPDSECNKRINNRAKTGGTPTTTPTQQKTKTANGSIKKTSTLIGGTPTNSLTKKKTDISQFFKKIEKSATKPFPNNNNNNNNDLDDDVYDSSTTKTPTNAVEGGAESPATVLLNRISSECYTPLLIKHQQKPAIIQQTSFIADKNNLEIDDENSSEKNAYTGGNATTPKPNDVKKALDFVDNNDTGCASPVTKKSRGRPKLLSTTPLAAASSNGTIPLGEIETATDSMQNMAISMTPKKNVKIRRRSTVNTPKDMSLAVVATPSSKVCPIKEEHIYANTTAKDDDTIETTIYNSLPMDQSTTTSAGAADTPQIVVKNHRRRTVYNYRTMEVKGYSTTTISSNTTLDKSNVTTRKPKQTINETQNVSTTAINMQLDSKEQSKVQNESIAPITCVTPPKATPSRRRTLYTPKKINETKINSRTTMFSDNLTNGGASVTTSTSLTNFDPKKVISSTFLENNNKLTPKEVKEVLLATPPADATTGVLQEEVARCVTPLVFSSTRPPGRRSTVFDVSMDIITQRLQCINQSARRSMLVAPPTTADAYGIKKTADLNGSGTTPIQRQLQQNSDNNSTPADTAAGDAAENAVGAAAENVAGAAKKRRKLFMPTETFLTPPSSSSATSNPANISQTASATKRSRKTLMPLIQTPTTACSVAQSLTKTPLGNKLFKSVVCSKNNRRSTLDFEQIQSIKAKAAAAALSTDNQQAAAKKFPILVCTNMHKEQTDVIREAVRILGGFTLENTVTDKTTHLVSLEARRTLNLLRALVRGLWILDYNWIVESLKVGKWLNEETYELQGFSRAIEICRSERQAFGLHYKCELFTSFGPFYLSARCKPIPKLNLQELVELCGGRVVANRQNARYIIGDENPLLENKLYLTPYWILDSITHMQIMKHQKYIVHQQCTQENKLLQRLPQILEEKVQKQPLATNLISQEQENALPDKVPSPEQNVQIQS